MTDRAPCFLAALPAAMSVVVGLLACANEPTRQSVVDNQPFVAPSATLTPPPMEGASDDLPGASVFAGGSDMTGVPPDTGTGSDPSAYDAGSYSGSEEALHPPDVGLRDSGTTPVPAPTLLGEPLPGVVGEWTYVEFPDTQCRDGSPAGVGINLGSANKLMIYLEGGGRCVNEETCGFFLFPANVEGGALTRLVAYGGVLDRSRAENPVRDWDIVYVPYCTGDRHSGANPDGNVPGTGPQKFVGYLNLQSFLERIVPTFPDTTDVLLTGISAGGFGVSSTADLVQNAFPHLKVKMINDSGPIVSSAVYTPCDQDRARTLWALDRTILRECGAACPNPDDYWMDYGVYLADKFSDRPTGVICAAEDAVERMSFGIGVDDCTGALDLFNPPISAADFRADLLRYRERIARFPNASTFYVNDSTHSFLGFDEFYNARAGGVRLVDWFAKIVKGESPGHAGP